MKGSILKVKLAKDIPFKLFLTWSACSSLVILFLVKSFVDSSIVFGIKDAPLYIFMLGYSFVWIRTKKTALNLAVVAVFLFYILMNYVILNPDYSNPVANIRQIVAPILILLFFCALKLDKEQVVSIEQFLKVTIFCVFTFGVFELLFDFWVNIDISNYFLLKGIPVDRYGLSYMFYEPIFNYAQRMTSSFLDPISLGHFFSTALIYFFYSGRGVKSNIYIAFICLSGLFLCLSKGALLQLFIALTVLNPRVHVLLKVACVPLPLVAFFFIQNKAGILIHLSGLSNSISSLSLFGYGIGSVGNYAKMFSHDLRIYYELGISDSFFGALLGQIGIVGALAWIFLLLSSITPLKSRGDLDYIILVSLICVSVISENTMNITSFLAPAIIIALAHWRKQCKA